MTIVTILHWVIPKLKILNHWSKKSSGPGGWVVEIRIKAQLSSAKLATGTELGKISFLVQDKCNMQEKVGRLAPPY